MPNDNTVMLAAARGWLPDNVREGSLADCIESALREQREFYYRLEAILTRARIEEKEQTHTTR